MEAVYKNCQSCGMPISRDPQGGGSEADGSKSRMYCGYCYKDGKFVLPEITLEQMQERVKSKIKESGFPGFMAGIFTRKIPHLVRWKNSAV
jgi:hypothetical protein